jgi:hypothetical protein
MSHYGKITPAELRDEPRKHVLMQATIVSADGPQPALIKDLTLTGARIRCARPLEEGADIIFKRGDDFRATRVAWIRKGEAGLQFYREG